MYQFVKRLTVLLFWWAQTNDISYLLSKAQASTQSMLANTTEDALRRGIGTEQGLYGLLKDGIFLNNHFSGTEMTEGDIQAAISRVARARLLAAIWKAKVCVHFYFFLSTFKNTHSKSRTSSPHAWLPHTFTHANQTWNLSHLISFKHGFVVANPGVFYCPWKCEWIETKKSESAPQLFLIWSVCRWRYHDPCADLEWHLICSGTLREMMTWLIFHSSLYFIDVSLGSLHTGWSQRCLRGRWRDVLLRWGWSVSPISIDKRWFKDLNSSIYIFKWVDISSEWWILFVHNWENSSLNFLGLTSCLPNTISRFLILLNTRGNASRNISPMRTTHIKTGR